MIIDDAVGIAGNGNQGEYRCRICVEHCPTYAQTRARYTILVPQPGGERND